MTPAQPSIAEQLAHCDREPVHRPGGIQAHGMLLAIDADRGITHVSTNAAQFAGRPAESLLGTPISDLLESADADWVEQAAQVWPHNESERAVRLKGTDQLLDMAVRAHRRGCIIELEPHDPKAGQSLLSDAWHIMSRLRRTATLHDLCQQTAVAVRQLTRFDRVMIYRFDADWNGRVVAESRDPGVNSYLGLHFPAADIPAQVRALYSQCPLRVIPDARSASVPVLAQSSALPADQLDLTHCRLRAVSPVHLEYLRNMGVSAALSVALFLGDTLWGLVTCNHESGACLVGPATRHVIKLIGELTSALIESKEGSEQGGERLRLKTVQNALMQHMVQDGDVVGGLTGHETTLLHAVPAAGAAIAFRGNLKLLGKTPDVGQIKELLNWLSVQHMGRIWSSDSLPTQYSPSEAYKDKACGLLAAPLSRGRNNWLVWFRPEVAQTVNWGGDPRKFEQQGGESPRLGPRTSFELWRQTVHLKSLPWRTAELQTALELSAGVVDILMQKSEELSQLNTELERSNLELDAFAYAASHDLKEPLRGIHNYSALVLRELGKPGSEPEARARLEAVIKLTERMEDLINSLLHYAHVGRMDLRMHEVDLNEVVRSTIDVLRNRLDESGTRVEVQALPHVSGDKVLLGEVFTNLLSNSLKYNDKAERWVKIGHTENEAGSTLFVRDNGIGIREKNLYAIFNIFRRLHSRDKFGGGTGTGLTITKQIVERHGGKIWCESHYGEGTTFYFTLGERQDDAS